MPVAAWYGHRKSSKASTCGRSYCKQVYLENHDQQGKSTGSFATLCSPCHNTFKGKKRNKIRWKKCVPEWMYLPNTGNFRIRAPFSLLFHKKILFSLTQETKRDRGLIKINKKCNKLRCKILYTWRWCIIHLPNVWNSMSITYEDYYIG